MAQPLEDAGYILLVTADAVECFCNDNVEGTASGSLHEGEHARAVTKIACADRIVAKHVDDVMTITLRVLATDTDLIVD